MSKAQKWLIVAGLWLLTLGLLMYLFSKRFVIESYSMHNKDGVVATAGFTRIDTWTGKMQLKMIFPVTDDVKWVEIKQD